MSQGANNARPKRLAMVTPQAQRRAETTPNVPKNRATVKAPAAYFMQMVIPVMERTCMRIQKGRCDFETKLHAEIGRHQESTLRT